MAQNPTAGVPSFFDSNTAMGLSSWNLPFGGYPAFEAESGLENSHLRIKTVAPIAAGQRGFRQDQEGYVELYPSTLREGVHSGVYILANHRVGLGRAHVTDLQFNQVKLAGIAAPWQRYNDRAMALAHGSPAPRMGGSYNLFIVVTQEGSDIARAGEQEHLNDFEKAWQLSHGQVIAAIDAIRKQPGRIPIAQGTQNQIDAQFNAARQKLLLALAVQLAKVDRKLVPQIDWSSVKMEQAAEQLEKHWRTVYMRLCGLSKIRDYTGTHKARVQVVVTNPGQAAQRGDASGFTVSPLFARQQQQAQSRAPVKNDPFASGNFQSSGAYTGKGGPPPMTRAEVPGDMEIRLGGDVADLRGKVDQLISLASPYFNLQDDVSSTDKDVTTYQW